MDAVRSRDDVPVMFKKVLPEEGPHELAITQIFSSPEFAGDPRNHCVPLLGVVELEVPGSPRLMVFPLLRPFNRPRFQTFGEFVAFFAQICEVTKIYVSYIRAMAMLNNCQGIQFMHEQNVAHRYGPFLLLGRCKFDSLLSDCTANNIMFDPSGMYPVGFHPVKIDLNKNFRGKATAYTRTERPPRYVLIDFGLSRQYTTREVVDEPLRGGDKSAPEHQQLGELCNPFHTDIYYIGNLVRSEFTRVRDQIRGSSI